MSNDLNEYNRFARTASCPHCRADVGKPCQNRNGVPLERLTHIKRHRYARFLAEQARRRSIEGNQP